MSVYFIQAGDDGPVKIGFSTQILTRLEHLRVAHYEPLRLLGFRPGTRRTEARIQRRLAPFQVKGDWFAPTPEVFAELCDPGDDDDDEPIGPLRRLRERSGKSRAQVAADLDVSERTLYRLEKMEKLPRRWVLVFAQYFGVEPEVLENDGVAA